MSTRYVGPIRLAIVSFVLALSCVLAARAAVSASPDDFGNSFAAAHPISLDSSGVGHQRGTIDPSRDVDFFRIVAPISGPLTVRQTADGSALNSHVSVYDASEKRLARNDGGGGLDAEISVPVSAGQTYYVRAAGEAGTTGNYRLGFKKAAQPNIVFILSDDQSFESVAKMPYLGGRPGWYRFDNAFINNATCCPSRATILTGQWSHHTGVEGSGGTPRFDDSDTLATRLDDAGYETGFFGKYHLGSTTKIKPTYIPPGWDEWKAYSTDTSGWYYDYTLNEDGVRVDYGSQPADYSTDVLAAHALDFIDRAARSPEPFFAIYAPRAPHNGWTAAPRHLGHHFDEPVQQPPNFNEADMSDKPAWWASRPLLTQGQENKLVVARRKQWDTLSALDEAVRSMVETLHDNQLLKRTIIVFMTDNGYAFGEHRWTGKLCAYEECNRTPLLVRYLGSKEGLVIPSLVGNQDIAPTLVELGGAIPPSAVDGRSFVPLLNGRAPRDWPDEMLLRGYNGGHRPSKPPTFWGLRTPQYKYIETVATGEVELYDLSADPFELQNVAGRSGYATIQAQLSLRLAELRGS